MKHYVGLDLHSNNTVVGILNEKKEKVLAAKLDNDSGLILQYLEPLRETIQGVVVESTYNWYWLVDDLMDSGYKVHLANPCAIQQYKGIKNTNDKSDALWLAELLALNILPVGYIHSRADRQLRDLFRKRIMLVRQRTQHILSFKSLMTRNLNISIRSDKVKTLNKADIDNYISEKNLKASALANINMVNHLGQEILKLEKLIFTQVNTISIFNNLMTVPGIGKTLGKTILLETGNIDRFATPENYASYCRLVPSRRISNNKSKGQNNTKNGNAYLCWAFIEAANFAKRHSLEAKTFHNKKRKKKSNVLATKALACKIAKACYYIIRDNVEFNTEKMFTCPTKKVVAVNQHGD